MAISLSINSENLDSDDIQNLTRDMCKTINAETDVKAATVEQQGEIGTRGGPIELGTLALEFLSCGAAVALFNVFKAYFERNRNLTIKIQDNNGKNLEINAENLSSNQIDQTMELVQDFLGN